MSLSYSPTFLILGLIFLSHYLLTSFKRGNQSQGQTKKPPTSYYLLHHYPILCIPHFNPTTPPPDNPFKMTENMRKALAGVGGMSSLFLSRMRNSQNHNQRPLN
jgi:hypothetical protein